MSGMSDGPVDASPGNRTGPALYEKAKHIIPGGTQLLSKRPEMYLPEGWPSYYARARGAEVWDLDSRRFTDVGIHGIGACSLGYADPDVDAAVKTAIDAGTMTTLNCPEEVELAELLIDLHPWAEQVRYTRAGGEALAVAVRIARTATDRDLVAFCGYHGWHDWYLSANLAGDGKSLDGHLLPGLDSAGVPRSLVGHSLPFHYNQLDELEEVVVTHGSQLAAIVMEPVRSTPPALGFLEGVRELASQTGAALIFDEVTSGWRVNTGGVHLTYGVAPDIAVFAKALANGYAMGAVVGRRSVMEAAQGSFISSTAWTERVGLAAALATIEKHRRIDAPSLLTAAGRRVRRVWRDAARASSLEILVAGLDPISTFSFLHEDATALRTLFIQEMLDRGFLATTAFYASTSHTDEVLDRMEVAVGGSFEALGNAVRGGDVERRLRGPVAHQGFYRLT